MLKAKCSEKNLEHILKQSVKYIFKVKAYLRINTYFKTVSKENLQHILNQNVK